MGVVAAILLLMACAGIGYTLFAAWLVGRFLAEAPRQATAPEPVSLLKPLHGAEPRLAENLRTFLDQDWDAPIEMICGIQRADDPAIGVVEGLGNSRAPSPPFVLSEVEARAASVAHKAGPSTSLRTNGKEGRETKLVVDPTPHGANAKVANLLNMAPAASHDLLVLSDSDMAVPRDYLLRLADALACPHVGAATCAYVGRGDAGRWSELAAGGIGYHFVPQLLVGLRLGLARPGMGSTIALRRETLAAIGGFARFADSLADDYELCEAVRALGLEVVVPPMLLVHACAERTLREVWRHEVRWAATILRINPGGHAGTIVTFPVPLALVALPFAPEAGAFVLLLAIAARLVLKARVDRAAGFAGMPAWLLLPRDCLSFAVFVRAFFARSVEWRGSRLRMVGAGRIKPAAESFPS